MIAARMSCLSSKLLYTVARATCAERAMSPIEVSENPLRANSFRLASRIFVRARGSPRRGRVIFGRSHCDWSATSQGRDYPKQLTRPTSFDLLGKLIPALAIADPRPQLPSSGLRRRFQLGP